MTFTTRSNAVGEEKNPILVVQEPVLGSDNREAIEEAYHRGKKEALASVRATFEGELAEIRRGREQEIEGARAQWVQETEEKLTAQIPAAFQDLEARIAESVSRILRPAMLAVLKEEVVASLSLSLTKLRSGEGGKLIVISGPDVLLDALRLRLPEAGPSIEFVSSQTAEVKAIADQTILDSQIQAWSSMLETGLS